MSQHQTIIIIGAGVMGLTTAISLSNRIKSLRDPNKISICIWTREQSPFITSDKAAAIWEPFLAPPNSNVNDFAFQTWDYFEKEEEIFGKKLYREKCGVQLMEGYLYNQKEMPDWATNKQKFQRLGESSWKSFAYMIDMSKYMKELTRRALECGVKIETVLDLEHYTQIKAKCDAYASFHNTTIPFVINATGLGSKTLFEDDELTPILGYTLIMKTRTEDELMNKNFHMRLDEKEGMMYVLPRTENIVVCGGTGYMGKWDTSEDPEEAERIIKRIDKFVPQIKIKEAATVLRHSVGLRPYRKSGFRIEIDKKSIPGLPVIHNYGMSGSGVTVCWGVAVNVCQLAESILDGPKTLKSKI